MKLGDLKVTAISILAALFLRFSVPTKTQTSSNEFPSLFVTKENDFIVKFKGDIYSWKNLSRLLRQHNVTVPDERAVLAAVLDQKKSTVHSCRGRCFFDERKSRDKTCFCDKACTTFRDCCLDFHSWCGQKSNVASLQKVACGNVNEYSWSGVIMKSSCSSQGHQSTNDCQNVQRLYMTLQKELPVFELGQNVTYRSIACARCNNGANLSFWGLNVTCAVNSESIATPVNITDVKMFVKQHSDCSWKYAPRTDLSERYESCVLPDTQCASNHLPVLSAVKELCSLYSMVFSVGQYKVSYRNPHCALCDTNGRLLPQEKPPPSPGIIGPQVEPLSILLDVSANIPEKEEPKNPPPTLITESLVQGYNLTAQVVNCTSNTTNCTVSVGGIACENFTLKSNQSVNKSHVIVLIREKQMPYEKNTVTLQGHTVYILCPEKQAGQGGPRGQVDNDVTWHNSTVLSYMTLTGTLLSIVSLCFLLSIYFSFKELRNLPGKCLINLSLALLRYQVIFLGVEKPKNIAPLCKAVAIFLHFFILAAFSWMNVMAFDTASTFTVQVSDVRRQPSDTRKTFIKYCIVGWGLPAVIVGLCCVLDFTRIFHFGYGISTYCWISGKMSKAVAMVTPVSLALVFNVACLTKSIYAIWHLQQGASQATNNSSRASLTLICIKLTTVMGLTWILGLIANWKQAAFLQYPSVALNSMQGLFITLCFITTKKVRGLLRNAFFKRWNGEVEPQTSVSRYRRTGILELETTAGSNTVVKGKCET